MKNKHHHFIILNLNKMKSERSQWALAVLLTFLCSYIQCFIIHTPASDLAIGDNPPDPLMGIFVHTVGIVMESSVLFFVFCIWDMLLTALRKFLIFNKSRVRIWVYISLLLFWLLLDIFNIPSKYFNIPNWF